MIPFEVVGRVPLFSPYRDEKKGTTLYPLNPAAISYDDRIHLLVREIELGETFDPTRRVSVYSTDWDFQEVDFIGELKVPRLDDEGLVNPIEDIRAGVPGRDGVVEIGYNVLYSRGNGENYPVVARGTLRPPYTKMENSVTYKGQVGKNVLITGKDGNNCKIVYRLDKFPPVFRHITDGEVKEVHDEAIVNRPYCAYDKVGFTGLPLTLSDHEKLFILHGFNVSDGVYRYSILPAVYRSGEYNISPEPMLSPAHVRDRLKRMMGNSGMELEMRELRPTKEVIYSDAIIPKNRRDLGPENTFNVHNIEKIFMPINLGDTAVYMIELYMDDLLDFCGPLI